MLLGILLGIVVSVMVTSLVFIFVGSSNLLIENSVTGAVIGTTGVISFAIIVFIISVVLAIFLFIMIRDSHKPMAREDHNKTVSEEEYKR